VTRSLSRTGGRETYDAWATCFRETWEELNAISGGKITVKMDDGTSEEYEIRFYLGKHMHLRRRTHCIGGDQKFVHCVMGLQACNADYACCKCFVHKDHRASNAPPESFVTDEMTRTFNYDELGEKKKV